MLLDHSPLVQTLLASLFTWGMTALGAAVAFVLPARHRQMLDASLGFAAGVMVAASFWCLLDPAVKLAKLKFSEHWAFLPVAVGFTLGTLFVHFSDRAIVRWILPQGKDSAEQSESTVSTVAHYRAASRDEPAQCEVHSVVEPIGSHVSPNGSLSLRRILLLVIAIAVHNFPEGLGVGVAFAGVHIPIPNGTSTLVDQGLDVDVAFADMHANETIGGSSGHHAHPTETGTSFEHAFNLALGIGLQNFPEGLAVAVPLVGTGHSPWHAFFYGQLSGAVEPAGALLGATLVMLVEPLLLYAFAFAAGAMIYVVFDSIVPEGCSQGNGKLCSACSVVGFLVMMCLEVGLSHGH